MTRRDEYRREGRWRRCLLLAVVALFVSWNLASALHAPAFALASDGIPVVAAHQLDLDTTDHHGTSGQACTVAQGHCSSPAIVSAVSVVGIRSGTVELPCVADMVSLASVAPVDRPPILSFYA